LVFAYPQKAHLDGILFMEERLALEEIHGDISGMGNAIEGVMNAERPWLFPLSGAIVIFVGVLLFIDSRNVKWMLVSLVPVSFGCIISLGTFLWLDKAFNAMMLLSGPLIVGLGVDDGIHVVHRMREDVTVPAYKSTDSVGQAIVMTTLTTCTSFAALLYADHPGMESLSLVLLVGLPMCLLASITMVPALAVLFGLVAKE